jgi:nitroimidazol reductase NimA-like FMN-containing flavoprotein (pyridoxamine 5'-phosphate oxidase superfamily)
MSGPASDRTTLRRRPERGRHERETIASILDAGFICHVGVVTAEGPMVLPTSYVRAGDLVYIHGSPASKLLRTARGSVSSSPVCITVTLLDGLVLARSMFHHSINYRSVVIFGEATEVTDLDEKRVALTSFVDHVVPDRSTHSRMPSEHELRSTLVLSVPLDEASAKIRTGPPVDDADDMGLAWWAGELPLRLVPGDPVPSPDLHAGIAIPGHVSRWSR